jgi:hypothetical protein
LFSIDIGISILESRGIRAQVAKGRVGFSEGASAKWIFDVEIEILTAEIFLHVKKTKIMLGGEGKFLINRLRPTFYTFIFTFPELAFMIFR